MSYGTYDNQSPLNQPFNPTANTNIGNEFGRVVGGVVADKLFGQDGQGPLSGLTRGLPGAIMNNVVGPAADRLTSGKNLQGIGQGIFNDNLPGAPSLEAQRNVEQSRAGGGILKLRQQPPMLGQQPGGKSGKSFQPMPSQPVERSQDIPIQEDIPGIITGPGITTPMPSPSPMPAVTPMPGPTGGKSGGGGMMPGGKSTGPIIDYNQFQRGDGTSLEQQAQPGIAADSNIGRAFGSGFFGGSMIPVNASGDTGQSALQKAQTDFFRGP